MVAFFFQAVGFKFPFLGDASSFILMVSFFFHSLYLGYRLFSFSLFAVHHLSLLNDCLASPVGIFRR